MMQGTSLLCSPNSRSPLPTSLPTSSYHSAAASRKRPSRLGTPSSYLQPSLNRLQSYRHAFVPLHSTAIEDAVETTTEAEYVEIGYVINVHGLEGEICVKPTTDFPELRFSEPGKRWLKQQYLGKETIQEVELIEGRGQGGRKGWILKLRGIDSVDQAKLLVGSTLLVPEEDRPELEEGEFYTRDLIGMRVIFKETGEHVGTVENVFKTGASDILQVMLDSSTDMLDGNAKPMTVETDLSNRLVWIPFVEAIVPDVDMNKREMHITPPKGLLEINVRSHDKSKKERRQLEWKERKKFQKRLIAAKKKLCEMEQQHVFHGFRFGEKSRGRLLADEIVGVNSALLQLALQNTKIPSNRWDGTELVSAMKNKLMRSTLKISEECLTFCASKEKLGKNFNLQERGLHLTSEGKVGMVLIFNEKQGWGSHPDLVDPKVNGSSPCSLLETLLGDDQRFLKVEDRASVPLILVCPAHEIQSLTELFLNNDHFAFDSEKVWFLEEEKLPVISCPLGEQNEHKILMKSPWEILQLPVGSGGVISVLSSHNIPENLSKMGVEYIQVCSINQGYVGGNSLLIGLVNSCEADIGVQISEEMKGLEESINMVFSTKLMEKLTKRINKLQFCATLKPNSHVEMVDKDWVDVVPTSPNSYEFSCSIYSSLNACPLDNVCVMQITK